MTRVLPKVAVHRFTSAPFINVENYRLIVGDAIIDEIQDLARYLKGTRVCHINSTGYGGGVAELLTRHVPLARALGLDTDWRLVQGTPEFFTVTKAFHNALQGAPYTLTASDKTLYEQVNRETAKLLASRYDVCFVHDPQPAAIRAHVEGPTGKWIWRCHIDTSHPDPEVAAFLLPYLRRYDAVVFTMKEFLLPGLEDAPTAFIAPAIDPLSTKNMDIPIGLSREILSNAGIDANRPLVVQISRFDPLKDPLGVIEAYRLAKRERPSLQLALVGAIAGDDPEGWRLLATVQEVASHDDDIFVFTNLGGVGNMEVNAFQLASDVIVQKSLREGFGLVVSEAFWKARPVIAGRAGGIPMQFPEGFQEYLVSDVGECASAIVELLHDRDRARDFGRAAREHVRRHFLLPRLLRDELKLIKSVLERR